MSFRSPLENEKELLSTSSSFPHAFSGNPGESRDGPPIKTFGGDDLGVRASSGQISFFEGAHEGHEERIFRLKKEDFGMSFSSFVLLAFFVVVQIPRRIRSQQSEKYIRSDW